MHDGLPVEPGLRHRPARQRDGVLLQAVDANAYAENGNTTSATSYIRDSYLDHIDYGFTDGNAYSGHAPDEVVFTTGDRCVTGTCDPLNSTNASNWPDVP